VLPLLFFFMTTKEKHVLCLKYVLFDEYQQCYPLCFIWWISTVLPFTFHLIKTTVLPLMFFSWRPINNDNVTPFVFFSWRPMKNYSLTPFVFLHDDQRKTTVLPLMFYLLNFDSVTPYVYFMTADKKRVTPHVFSMLTNKKRQWYPSLCICGDPNLSCVE
jgi:hypothetical protein